MTRRRALLFGMPLAVAALAVGVWFLWPGPSAINDDNYKRIEVGMALPEVERILGGPARDERTGDVVAALETPSHCKDWITDEVWIRLAFNDDGRVLVHFISFVSSSPGESFFSRLRRWLGP